MSQDFRRSVPADFSERPGSSKSSESDRDEVIQPTIRNHRKVKRVLNQWHIFLITISGVIGMGLFENSGEVLRISGPLGGISAYIVVGIVVICVMEGIAEMVGHWPIANCMFEFIAKFVDKDLAIVIGIAYWYCYAIGFATLILAAANLATFWVWSTTIQDLVFTIGIMIVIVCINCIGVLAYARVESGLGIMKIILVIGSFLTMLGVNQKDTNANAPGGKIGTAYIDDRFQHNPNVASSNGIAVLVVIPIAAYAYCGVEIVAVTALEAINQKSLKFPAKWIAYLTTITYIISIIGFYLNVSWLDPALPSLLGRKNETMIGTNLSNSTLQTVANSTTMRGSTIIIISTLEAKIPVLPDILNFGLIVAVLSTSNTSLYVASRTLYGLTQGVNPKDPLWGWLSIFSRTTPETKIPAFALLFSAFAFCWVPFLRFSRSLTNQELQEIMSGIATVAVIIVWAALCLAFIRYRKWLKMHEGQLKDQYLEYNYWAIKNKSVPFRTVLGGLQPLPAWIGLISCLLIITIFASAGWWNGKEKFAAVAAAYAGPIILLIIFCILKHFRRRGGGDKGWVKLGTWEELQNTLNTLAASRDDEDDEDDEDDVGEAGRQSAQEHQSMGEPSIWVSWLSKFPKLSQWFGGSMFTKIPGPMSDHYRDVSGNVSPTTRPTFRPIETYDTEDFEMNPMTSPTVEETNASDLYRTSISGSLNLPRKPVPTSRSSFGEQALSEPSGRLVPPVEAIMTPTTARSQSLVDPRTPLASPRISHTLLPPEIHDNIASGASSSQPAVVDERDLHMQDTMRQNVWSRQLTPQSPPPVLSPSVSRQARSEPDVGVHTQRLQRSPESATGLRNYFERDGDI